MEVHVLEDGVHQVLVVDVIIGKNVQVVIVHLLGFHQMQDWFVKIGEIVVYLDHKVAVIGVELDHVLDFMNVQKLGVAHNVKIVGQILIVEVLLLIHVLQNGAHQIGHLDVIAGQHVQGHIVHQWGLGMEEVASLFVIIGVIVVFLVVVVMDVMIFHQVVQLVQILNVHDHGLQKNVKNVGQNYFQVQLDHIVLQVGVLNHGQEVDVIVYLIVLKAIVLHGWEVFV